MRHLRVRAVRASAQKEVDNVLTDRLARVEL